MWHEKFGLEENPYDIRNLSEKVIGEEAQEKQLIKHIANGRAVLLYGETGIGKTTLIVNLIKKVKQGEINELQGFKCMYYSCDTDNLSSFHRDFLKTKLFSLGSRDIVVFLDEDTLASINDIMRVSGTWHAKKIKSVVYVQINENPKDDRLVRRIGIYKIKMRTITKDEIAELIRQRSDNIKIFNDDAIQHIAGSCNLNPSIALQRCDAAAEELANPKKQITLKQVKNFNFESAKIKKEISASEEETEDKLSKLRLSPLKKNIISMLKINSMTIKELAESCNTSLNTVSKQLNELMKKGMVVIVNAERPKKYGLEKKFERSILTD